MRSEGIILRLIFGEKGGANDVAQHRLPPESQLDTRDDALQPHQISTSSASQTKSWEADLNNFLRVCKTGVKNDGERKRAQEFVDGLDMVRHTGAKIGYSDRVSRLLSAETFLNRNGGTS